MNRCDWPDCPVEVGLFEGVPASLLSGEGRNNIPVDKNRFVTLCLKHFEVAVGKPPDANEE